MPDPPLPASDLLPAMPIATSRFGTMPARTGPATGIKSALIAGLLVSAGCSEPELVCGDCSVAIDPAVDLAEDGGLEWESHVIAASAGYIAAPAEHASGIAVFDHNGKLARLVGRQGGGPGEFREIHSIAAGPEDMLFVSDANRLVVLDSTFGYLKSVPLPMMPREITPLSRSHVVVHIQRLASSEPCLALVDLDDGSVTLFGSDSEATPYSGVRQVVPWADGVATIREFEYLVELYSFQGDLLEARRVDHPWFPRKLSLNALPKARVVDAAVIDGHLWTLSYRERESWTPPSAVRVSEHGAPVKLSASEMRARYEQRIDVVDLSSRADLVASFADAEQSFNRFAAGGHLLGSRSGEEDFQVSLWRLRLLRP